MGGPAIAIIAVLFDHPLITPLRAVADWVPLIARREMIVEQYRTVRVQGLPPTLMDRRRLTRRPPRRLTRRPT
jgi:hypothetical protein